MSYYNQVSAENRTKVETFFVQRTKETGSNRIEATVIEIAEGSGVALATAHKAIKELQKNKTITVIKPPSRRFAITYIYNGDIVGFEEKENEKEQIEYLKNLVIENRETINIMQQRIDELEAKLRNSSQENIETITE